MLNICMAQNLMDLAFLHLVNHITQFLCDSELPATQITPLILSHSLHGFLQTQMLYKVH